MARQKNYCCKKFKDLAKSAMNHQKCDNGRGGGLVSGRKLNVLLGVPADSADHMDPGESHFVCRNVIKKANLIQPQDSRLRRAIVPAPPRQSRRIQIQDPDRPIFDPRSANHLKEFRVRANGVYVDEEDEEEEEEYRVSLLTAESTCAPLSLAQRRCIQIREGCKKYKKVYGSVQHREQRERVEFLSKQILSAVANRVSLRHEGLKYLVGNEAVASEANTVLAQIKCHLEKRYFKLKFDGLYDGVIAEEDVEDEGEFFNAVTGEEEVADVDEQVADDIGEPSSSNSFALGSKIYSVSSVKNYKAISSLMVDEFGGKVRNSVKTVYQINRDRPEIVGGVVLPCRNLYDRVVYEPYVAKTFKEKYAVNKIKHEKGDKIVCGHDVNYFAEIAGGYPKVLDCLLEKRRTLFRNCGAQEDLVVLNSFDGAIHGVTNKKQLNITSYSSTIVSVDMLKRGLSSASTSMILTWKQVMGDEKVETVFPVVKSLYEWIGKHVCGALVRGKNITIYEVHDCKMLYSLLQCSMWNRKHHPFCLCDCMKGDGVINPDHVCTFITDENHVKLWEQSLKVYTEKSQDPRWNESHHKDYCDFYLKGCTHFGFHPRELIRSSIRFDMLHLRCSLTRKLAKYLMEFLSQQHVDLQDHFELLLLSFWSQFCVTWWELERPLAKFKGPELILFIENTPAIADFLLLNFPEDEQAIKISKVLMVWHEITPFLTITYIDDKASYQAKLDKFVLDLKEFYLLGSETFLSTNYAGDEENFYSHCVRFYLPKIAEVTLEKHNMGLGIFTMQGFEHRNKESKT